jgi:hypothetical protein
MPIGFGRVKTKGRPLSVTAHLKKSIVEVKAETNCLAHALIIAIAKTNDPNYKAYRQGRKILPMDDKLLETTRIDLKDGGGIQELMKFQEHFKEYRIVVYGGLNCEAIVFDGQAESEKRLNLLFDDFTYHHVITNVTDAMANATPAKNAVEVMIKGVM